jgi:predicted DNA binding CopG/RHH family protein
MKTINLENLKLDKDEKNLEDNFEKLVGLSPKEEKEKIKMLTEAAKKHVKKNKDKRITLRIYSEDLEKIKALAREDGLPYQTYLTSLLHKILTGKIQLKFV